MTNKYTPHRTMTLCAIAIGIAVGICVVMLIKFFNFIHNLFFFGQFNFNYNEVMYTPQSPWGIGVILVPVIGSFIVSFIINRFANGERGLSVPEVIYSIHFKAGSIAPIPAFAKAIASMISIGTGGSLGREGPLVQLGAALSALMDKVVILTAKQKAVLIAAGSAAGTAVTFNAPIGGLLFVIEILLINIDVTSIILIILAEVFALMIKWYFFPDISIFALPNTQGIVESAVFYQKLLLFVPFGMVLGLISVLFIHGLYYTEDLFERTFKNAYLRHALGMLIVGCMFYLLMRYTGHYYIEGIGFSTIKSVLNFQLISPWLLLILVVCKIVSTFLTLGSGASGGIFSPSLFIGALLGGIMCHVHEMIFHSADPHAVSYVIAGMAGMLGSVTGGVLTAIVLCIEITQNYQSVLPIFLTVVVAFGTRSLFCHDSGYTLKLTRRKLDLSKICYTDPTHRA